MSGARTRSVFSEAWRNIASGTTHAAAFALVLAIVAIVLGLVDAATVTGLARQAEAFRSAGGSVWVLRSPESIDGTRCENQAAIPTVTASGALRAAGTAVLDALPAAQVRVYEATPGWLATLATEPAIPAGAWIAADLADTLGVAVGDNVVIDGHPTLIAAVFPYPPDGRDPAYANTIVLPVAAVDTFDECWSEIWPRGAATAPLLQLPHTARPDAGGGVPVVVQLNTTLGTGADFAAETTGRLTRCVPLVTFAVALALGVVGTRMRRLELASALHAGYLRLALIAQAVLEAALWSVVATAISAAVIVAGTASDGLTYGFATAEALRAVLTLLPGATLGAAVAALTIRERLLFRYFKGR